MQWWDSLISLWVSDLIASTPNPDLALATKPKTKNIINQQVFIFGEKVWLLSQLKTYLEKIVIGLSDGFTSQLHLCAIMENWNLDHPEK